MKDQLHFTIKEDKIYLKDGDRLVLVENQRKIVEMLKWIEYCDNAGYRQPKGFHEIIDSIKLNPDKIYTLTGYKVEKYNWINPCIPAGKCLIADVDRQNNCDQINERRCKNMYMVAVISPIEEESTINYRVIDYRVINNQIPLHECWGLKPEENTNDKVQNIMTEKIDKFKCKHVDDGEYPCAKQCEQCLKKELAELKDGIGNLLAIMHGDGGHYTEKYGFNKSIRDAIVFIGTKYVTNEHMIDINQISNENAELRKELDRAKQINTNIIASYEKELFEYRNDKEALKDMTDYCSVWQERSEKFEAENKKASQLMQNAVDAQNKKGGTLSSLNSAVKSIESFLKENKKL